MQINVSLKSELYLYNLSFEICKQYSFIIQILKEPEPQIVNDFHSTFFRIL